jgi:hypothetical protein
VVLLQLPGAKKTAPHTGAEIKCEQQWGKEKTTMKTYGTTGAQQYGASASISSGITAGNTSAGAQKNLPEKKFRAGPIAATIWANNVLDKDGKVVTYRTVSFERSYKDKNDAWKTTSSLRMNDLPKASLVLEKAFEYLALANLGEESA